MLRLAGYSENYQFTIIHSHHREKGDNAYLVDAKDSHGGLCCKTDGVRLGRQDIVDTGIVCVQESVDLALNINSHHSTVIGVVRGVQL